MTASISNNWRQAIIKINNTTGYDFTFMPPQKGQKNCIHGRFDGKEPPANIAKGTTGEFTVNKNDIGSTIGPEGTATYRISLGNDHHLDLVFYWNHPQSSAKSVYSVSSNPPGHVTFALSPANPTGHNQTIQIEPVLQRLAQVYDKENWMRALPDDRLISSISIPGTHDSGATEGGHMAQCQRLSIKDQLNLGIRFLDIRLKRKGPPGDKVLDVYHGITKQPLTFPGVILQCESFLSEHSDEFILMLINDEANPETEKQEFAALVDKHITDKSELFYTSSAIPENLKEARGKVVVLRRYPESTIGIDCTSFPHNKSGSVIEGKIYSQDFYKVEISDHIADTISAAEKVEKIRKAMDYAKANENELVLNFTSGWGSAGPLSIANRVQEDVVEMLAHYGKARTGVVILDFCDDLLGHLVSYTIATNTFPEQPI